MKYSEIKSCYIGPAIPPEQFIPEHFFLFLSKGKMNGYDGNRHFLLKSGDACILRKNHLARYSKEKVNGEFEKVVIIFDEVFLRDFQNKHAITYHTFNKKEAFIQLSSDDLVKSFLRSLDPYYNSAGKLDDIFSELKREELLLILLKQFPELSDVLFDFGIPGRVDLEAFMQKNYKFNVNIERFAFLTGRSLSAFKRDFKQIFNETPNRWLVKRRLEEARFLIERKNQKPSEFYIDLGFEDLSHFYFAFKKRYGQGPSQLLEKEVDKL